MDVYTWARDARPGQRVCYHTGVAKTYEKKVSETFSSAMRAHEDGLVFLAQRRIKLGKQAGELAYEATRISPFIAFKLRIIDKDMMRLMERETGDQMFRDEIKRRAA